jgi:5-aminolevulinate synthase
VAATKKILREASLPLMMTETHIVPVMVGDPDLCKQASDLLLDRHGIYIQPINYPTVARGTERLRITPTPAHDVRLIGQLAEAMVSVWHELDLPLGSDYPEQMLQLGAPWMATSRTQAIPGSHGSANTERAAP